MRLPDGKPKGLQRVLEERGFNVSHLRAKCSPVCPFKSQSCCMARLLSQQDDFMNQPSMLETLITSAGHKSVFLPKFHCELNPIEMVSSLANTLCTSIMLTRSYYQYWGWSIVTVKKIKRISKLQKMQLSSTSMCVPLMLSEGLSIVPGSL